MAGRFWPAPRRGAERAVKWVRRHPAIAALAGLVALVAGLGLTGIIWQWHEAVAARRQAVAARRNAEQKADAEGRARTLAEGRLYGNRILLAQAALDQGQFGQASRALQSATGQPRGWEWNYLDATRDASCCTVGSSFFGCGELHYVLDGKALIALGDTQVQLVDPETATVLGQEAYSRQALHTPAEPCPMFALSPDRKTAAIGDLRRGAVIWDLATNKRLVAGPVAAPAEHRSGNVAVNFSGDGRRVIASIGKTVRLQDAATGKTIEQFDVDADSVLSVACSPDGRFVACGCQDLTVRVIALETKKEVFRSKKHLYRVTFVAFTPDGKRLVSWPPFGNPKTLGHRDRKADAQIVQQHELPGPVARRNASRRRDLRRRRRNTSLEHDQRRRDARVAGTWRIHQSCRLVVGRQAVGVRRTRQDRQAVGCPERQTDPQSAGPSIGRSGPWAFPAMVAGWPRLRRASRYSTCSTVRIRSRSARGRGSWRRCAFSTTARCLRRESIWSGSRTNSTICTPGIVDLWDTDAGKLVRTLRGHVQEVSCMALAGERRWLATGSDDGTVKVWDLSAKASRRPATRKRVPRRTAQPRPEAWIATSGPIRFSFGPWGKRRGNSTFARGLRRSR